MAVLAPEVRSDAPRWLIRHETLLAAILVVALAILGLFNERFLTIDNLLNQGRLMTEVSILLKRLAGTVTPRSAPLTASVT